MMAAAVLLGAGTAKTRLFGIAGAIIRHTGRSGGNRGRRDDCHWRRLDEKLRCRRRNICGSATGFPARFVRRSSTPDNE